MSSQTRVFVPKNSMQMPKHNSKRLAHARSADRVGKPILADSRLRAIFSWQNLYAHPELLLVALGAWHLLFWVLVPVASYRMLPLDTLELLGWGQEWQWGYYKHPPLGAWIGEATYQLFAGNAIGLYLLAQTCVLVTLVYVWKTARLFLEPRAAVLSTVILEAAYWYTYLTPNFNMNTLQLPVWAGLTYHFARALRGDAMHWGAWGVFVALCLLTKYSGLLIVGTCVAIMLLSPRGRQCLRHPGPYVGLLVAGVLLLPHLLWISQHGQLPWNYLRGFDRDSVSNWHQHLLEPLRFAAGALLGLSFSALLFLLLADKKPGRAALRGDRLTVLALCLGPLLLSMLFGAVTGSRLKSTWAFGYFNLAGIALFLIFPTRINVVRYRRFCLGLTFVALLTGGSHLAYKTFSDRSKTAFDGRALAVAIAGDWQANIGSPLQLVIGDHMLSAIVSAYAPSRPSMLINGDFTISLWVTDAELRRKGAVVVCATGANCFPAFVARAGPRRHVQIGVQHFDYFFLAPESFESAASGMQ